MHIYVCLWMSLMLLCSDHLELIQKPNLSHQQCHQSKSRVPGALCWKSFPRYRPDSSNLRWRSWPEAEAWVVWSGGETLSKPQKKMAFHSCTSSRPWLNHLIKAWSSPQLPSNPHLPQNVAQKQWGTKKNRLPGTVSKACPRGTHANAENITPAPLFSAPTRAGCARNCATRLVPGSRVYLQNAWCSHPTPTPSQRLNRGKGQIPIRWALQRGNPVK